MHVRDNVKIAMVNMIVLSIVSGWKSTSFWNTLKISEMNQEFTKLNSILKNNNFIDIKFISKNSLILSVQFNNFLYNYSYIPIIAI